MEQPSDTTHEARTLVLRLRREAGSTTWRGLAICVQTGLTRPVQLRVSSNADIEQVHAILQTLLADAPDGSPSG